MLYSEYLTCKKPYQEAGYLFLLERKHACLFYKPGKGKTFPAIDAIRDIDKTKNGKARVLILSTADAIKNMWEAEIVPQNILPTNTVMMSFNSAIVDKTKSQLLRVKWDILVIDESHKIKSNTAKTSKLVFALSKNCEYVFGLSGTPRGNSDIDIFCQFRNMHISEWGDISYTYFVDNCCTIDQKFFKGNCIKVPTGIKDKYKAGWERNIAMYTQRVEYSEEDNMPLLNVNLVELPYTPTKEYLQAEDGIIKLADYETTMTKLAATLKLQQAVNGFLYLTDEVEDKRQVWHIERNKKLDWLNKNLTDEPTVIVYRFAEDLNNLKTEFGLSKWTEVVEEFKSGKATLLFLQCSRCESFNLQMCNRIIFYTMDYSYIKYNQMLHRVYRMGQTKPVQIDILTFKDTIETKVWEAVKNKEKFADLFMKIKGV